MEFNSKFGKIVGGLLIAVGILSVIFNAADLGAGMSSKNARNFFYDKETGKGISMSEKSLGIAAHGIWCGILFIVAGSFGVSVSRHFSECKLTTFAVLTIVGAVLGLIQLVIAALGASAMDNSVGEYSDKKIADIDCDEGITEDAKTLCAQLKVVYAAEILLALFGAFALVLNVCGFLLCRSAKGWLQCC